MLGVDARVEDLKKSLIDLINEANLPACLLDYVVTEILNNIRMQRMSQVQKQREEFQKEQEESLKEPKIAPGEVIDEQMEGDLPCSN